MKLESSMRQTSFNNFFYMRLRLWKSSILALPVLNACFLMPKCEEYKASFLDKEAHLVLQTDKSVGREIDFRGYEPVTTKSVTYKDTGGFYIYIIEAAEVGDTLIKKRNQTWFVLKKKTFNLKFDVQCKEEEYLKHRTDTLKKEHFKWTGS